MAEPCKFFAQGHCSFGNVCRFAHIRPANKAIPARKAPAVSASQEQKIDPYDQVPCTFARLEEKYAGQYDEQELKEYWRNDMMPLIGEHLAPIVEKADRGRREVCRFFLKGGCTFGESCKNLHVVDVADLDHDAWPNESVRSEAPEWLQTDSSLTPGPRIAIGPRTMAADTNPQEFLDIRQASSPSRNGRAGPSPAGHVGQGRKATAEIDDADCVICTDSIRKRGERFGMLENCDHAFCLSCIRAWRKQREQQDRVNLRMCPLCRNESFFVIPCDRLILDPTEKALAIEEYKRGMAETPCKAFDYGRGKCPLGSSCFYAHLNPDGTRFIPKPQRRIEGANGVNRTGEVKLSDFFD